MRSSAAEAQMQLMKRRLLSGGVWALGGRIGLAFTGLLTNALLARLLSPAELGAYFLAFSIVASCAGLATLGMTRAVVRFIAESIGLKQYDKTRAAIRIAVGLVSLSTLIVAIAYFFLGGALAGSLFDSRALVAVSGLIAGWILVASLQGVLVESFRGFHDIRVATLLGGLTTGNGLVTGGLLTCLLLLLGVFREKADLATVMLLAMVSGGVSTLIAGWLLHRRTASLPRGDSSVKLHAREVLHVAWPLMIANLATTVIAQADLWVVGAFLAQEEVAVYGAAVRLMLFVYVPLQIVNMIVAPTIAEMYAQGRRYDLGRTLRIAATIAGIPSTLVLVSFIVAGGPIMALIFGSYYQEGALVLVLLSLGRLVQVWSGASEQTLMMTGNQVLMMIITLFGGLFIVVGAMWAVGTFGAVGVAGATAIGIAMWNILQVLCARVRTGIWTHVLFLEVLSLGRRT